jgi:hypothetical protein
MQDDVHKTKDQLEKKILKGAESASLVIPEAVRDIDNYKRYVALRDAPAIKLPGRLIQTSDPNTVVDPMAHLNAINMNISHLPSDEQDDITRRIKAVKVLHFKIGALKNKAYGLKRRHIHSSLSIGVIDERSSEVIQYYGSLLTTKEIHKIIANEWGYNVSIQALRKFKVKNADKIEVLKQEYVKDHTNIRLAHKKGRLEELQSLFIDRKNKYDTTKGREDYKLLLATLRLIKDETEDKTLRIDANISANITISIQNHINAEVMKGLTINDIILARVASRMNINPRFLIARLHNSMYASHSGFLRPDGDLENQEIPYPSKMVYNWETIKKQHDAHGDKNIEDAQWEDVPKDQLQPAQDIKQVLIDAIKNKQQSINIAQDRVDTNTTKKDPQ